MSATAALAPGDRAPHGDPAVPRVRFDLPPERSATEPPEARGQDRDEVRLLVATADALHHTRFRQLPEHLSPGDLVVVNTSATLPAAVDAVRRPHPDAPGTEEPVVVHVAGPHPDGDDTVVIELRRTDGQGPITDARVGEVVALPDRLELTLVTSFPDPGVGVGSRLWRAIRTGPMGGRGITRVLEAHGRPITYGYLAGRWPLASYQPVYAQVPGSAEMASAGRPFTTTLVTELIARGIAVAPVVLHAGVSSLEEGEVPPPERYAVPEATARQVELTHRSGGRVVAVGTTVARALETVAAPDGRMWPGSGWTELVLGPDRPPRVVSGLITGWHAPDASHLRLLEAVAGAGLVQRAYDAALAAGYRWHEFGDSCLLLP